MSTRARPRQELKELFFEFARSGDRDIR